MTSFAGESQARMCYTYFGKIAKKEGFEQIAAIFMETAEQEKEHANGISILIPCHRIIGSNNSLTGYTGGLEAKQMLLEIEEKGSTNIIK